MIAPPPNDNIKEQIRAQVTCVHVLDAHGIANAGNNIRCPFPDHEDRNPSFSLCHEGRGFKCFGCDKSGDVFDLEMALSGCDFHTAEQTLQRMTGLNETDPGPAPVPKRKTTRKPGKTHPDVDAAARAAAWKVRQDRGDCYTETRRDFYNNADRQAMAAMLRFDSVAGGEKTFVPVHAVHSGWRVADPPGLWPLFNLPAILATDDRVYVVEGEKAACAGDSIGLATTTSAHGSKSPAKTDWTPLAGREVCILPDADEAGRGYAETVARLATEAGATSVRIVEIPNLPEKGDLVEFVEQLGAEQARSTILNLIANTPPYAPPKPSLEDQTKAEHGAPYFVNPRNGSISLNEAYWAGLYAREHIILHCPGEQQFYRYNDTNGLYEPISADLIKTDIGRRIHRAATEWRAPGLSQCRQDRKLASIVNHLKGQVEDSHVFRKPHNPCIHIANGVIVIKDATADLVEFSPTFKSRNQSPIAFDASAQCPRFLNELILPAVHEDDVLLIQKVFGLYLLGDNIIQRFMILDGTSNGGKGTLAWVMKRVLGTHNCIELRTEQLAQRFEIYRYLPKSLLYGPDVPANFLNTKGASRIKALVGGDLLDPEGKNLRGSFPIEGRFNILITSNSRLRVNLEGDVGAWRRRLLIVRYANPPPKRRIVDFDKVLIKEEGPGILNWALQGLEKLLEDVGQIGDIALTDRQKGIVDALLAESDSLRVYLNNHVQPMPGNALTVNAITEGYAAYCPDKGWNPLPITVVHRQLEELMLELFQVTKSHSCGGNGRERGYRGVGFT